VRDAQRSEEMAQGAMRNGSGGNDLRVLLSRLWPEWALAQAIRFRGLKSRPGLPDKTMMVTIVAKGRFCA
jgi:hypothetical protein